MLPRASVPTTVPTVSDEDCLRLPVQSILAPAHQIVRDAKARGEWPRGAELEVELATIGWRRAAALIARTTIAVNLRDDAGEMRLKTLWGSGRQRTQTVRLIRAPGRRGDAGWMAICSLSNTPRQVLFAPIGGAFASRQAHRIQYASENMGDAEAALRVVHRVRAKLDAARKAGASIYVQNRIDARLDRALAAADRAWLRQHARELTRPPRAR